MFQLNPNHLKKSRQRLENTIFQFREHEKLHNPIGWTNYLFELIQHHDLHAILDYLNQNVSWQFGELSTDPLRNTKNLAICLVVELSSKSITAQLLESEPAFFLSDTAIQLIEEGTSMQDVKDATISYLFLLKDMLKKQSPKTQHYLVQMTKAYIQQHFNTKFKIGHIAKELHTSASYLAMIFKQYEHMTIQTYIQKERVHRAKQLLAHTDETISNISQMVGFSSQSHLGKVLKDWEGMTPREYRASCRIYY